MMTDRPTAELTTPEYNSLIDYETTIERGLKTFYEVGNALTAIRDQRLYRTDYHTFEDYCEVRWGMSKTHANRLIQSAEVVANVTPIGVIPQSEAQARPLSGLEPALQRAVWTEVVESAPDGRITAKHVQSVVAKSMLGAAAPTIIPVYAAEQSSDVTPPKHRAYTPAVVKHFSGREDSPHPIANEESLPPPKPLPASAIQGRLRNAVADSNFLLKLDPGAAGRTVTLSKRQGYLDWLKEVRAWTDAFEQAMLGTNSNTIIVITEDQTRAG